MTSACTPNSSACRSGLARDGGMAQQPYVAAAIAAKGRSYNTAAAPVGAGSPAIGGGRSNPT